MSVFEFVYNQVSQLWGNKMPLCGQYLATEPFSVSPVSVSVIFLPSGRAKRLLECLQAYAVWQALLCHVKCYQKPPQ